MFDPFQKFLPAAAIKYGFNKELKAIGICHEYARIAGKIFSPEAEKQTLAKCWDKNILTITVANSAWAQQIQINKHKIKQLLNEKFGKKVISKIKIELS